MANKNSNLGASKTAKNDEFYTQYEKDFAKLTETTIIKIRIEFDQTNFDVDDKKFKVFSKNVANSYRPRQGMTFGWSRGDAIAILNYYCIIENYR